MTRETTGNCRKSWLLIAHSEKAWSAAATAEALGVMVEPIRMSLSQGAARGFFTRHPAKPGEAITYGVTDDNKVPSGITRGQVLREETA